MGATAIVCPRCGTKTQAGHDECPRCETTLVGIEPADSRPHARQIDSWPKRLRLRPLDGALLAVCIVAAVVIGRGQEEPRRPTLLRTEPTIATATANTTHPEPPETLVSPDDGDLPDPLLTGRQWLVAGAKDAALRQFRRAVAARPGDPEARHELGRLLTRMGRPDEAVAHLERAAQERAREWRYRADFAEALGALGDWDRAASEYDSVVKLRPDDATMRHRLGLALHHSGDDLEAVKAYLQALEVAPDTPVFYWALGTSYEALGKPADAAVAYGRFLELEPAGDGATAARGRLMALDAPQKTSRHVAGSNLAGAELEAGRYPEAELR